MKRLLLSLVAVAGLLGAPARAAAPESLTHDATERSTAIAVRVDRTLKILLPARREPGHKWTIIANDSRIIKPKGEPAPTATPKTGEPPRWEITFVTQRPGRSVVRFLWKKDGADDVAGHDDLREVTVRVQ